MQFSADYFKDDYRDDFFVCEMMKRCWAAEIEVLEIVADICKRNALTYIADWGTLLGAVRHKGFIPWDDDIDISLRREDYNRLIQILPDELPYGFAMTGMYAKTERLQELCFADQIRVATIGAEWKLQEFLKRFHGFPYQVAIDIFPLDYISGNEDELEVQQALLYMIAFTLHHWEEYQRDGALEQQLGTIEEFSGRRIVRDEHIKNRLWRLYDNVCSLYHREEAEDVTNMLLFAENPTLRIKKEWLDDIVYLPFEETEVAVPARFHEILTMEYGDYMVPVRNGALHNYPYYQSQENVMKEKLREIGYTGDILSYCKEMMR